MMEWVTAAARTVWDNAGELLETVSQWQTYAELVQVIHELEMWQAIFNLHTRGPNDECFTSRMKDLVLNLACLMLLGLVGDSGTLCGAPDP